MQIQFATKKIDGAYEGALIVDGKFNRSGSSRSLVDLLSKIVGPLLAIDREDGAEVVVNIATMDAHEVARQEASEERQRQTAIAKREADEIEALTTAVQREKAARDAAKAEVRSSPAEVYSGPTA